MVIVNKKNVGINNAKAKLTEDDVKQIRKLSVIGNLYQWEIATKYKISDTTVSLIVNRKLWKHI
jgi:DNA invertase Pin-like site-specific DNA recombinase